MPGHRFRHTRKPNHHPNRYGRAHQQERKRWEPIVAAGQATCQQGLPGNGSSGRCLYRTRWIQPGTPWALGHNDTGTTTIGPVHARCNQREAATRGGRASLTAQKRRRTQRTGWHSQPW